MYRRREFIRSSALTAGALAFGPGFWRDALAAPATPGAGPYGPLQAADANGVMLPPGFSSRVIARAGTPVLPTAYGWPVFPDGSASFATEDGGWILAVNSESPLPGQGGASAVRFAPGGSVMSAYSILSGTRANCAGGPTPWGAWLSCEEFDGGRVWECDPRGQSAAAVRPALGVFSHEAVCVDPVGQRLYLTEDKGDGGLYRFTPTAYPSLAGGILEIAKAGAGGAIVWTQVPDPSALLTPTRSQVPDRMVFRRGEGIWFDSGVVYVATTSDDRIYAYNTATETIEVLYDGAALGSAAPLHDVDNVTAHPLSGDLFVCEDDDDLEICLITRSREVARFLRLAGPEHGVAGTQARSETTGVAFNPQGTRMYFSSQRAFGTGVTYEVSGPFRAEGPGPGADGPGSSGVGAGSAASPAGAGAGSAGPAPAGPGPVRALRVRAPRTVRLRVFVRRGVLVTVDADRTGPYEISLTTQARRTRAKAESQDARRRRRARTGLARARRTVETEGELRVRLKPRRSVLSFLRGRKKVVRATITVTAPGDDGQRRKVTRPLRLKP